MADQTKISWAHSTFNPWMGCTKVSTGCKNCYAETLTKNRMGLDLWGPKAGRQVTTDANWRKPLKWNREAEAAGERPRVFCGSLCDVFEDHPTATEARPRLWDLIRSTPSLDWLLLTKRAESISQLLPADWAQGYPNVWLGVSIETMGESFRGEMLASISASVRFISYEPALGPLEMPLYGIDWVIYGGESGPGYRPDEEVWSSRMWDRCQMAGVAFWMKQRSGPRPGMNAQVRGEVVQELPIINRRADPIPTVGQGSLDL